MSCHPHGQQRRYHHDQQARHHLQLLGHIMREAIGKYGSFVPTSASFAELTRTRGMFAIGRGGGPRTAQSTANVSTSSRRRIRSFHFRAIALAPRSDGYVWVRWNQKKLAGHNIHMIHISGVRIVRKHQIRGQKMLILST